MRHAALGLLIAAATTGLFACATLPAGRPPWAFCPNDLTPMSQASTQACEGREAWLAANAAYWTRLGATMPRAQTMVVISALAVHHFRDEWSIIAVRDEAGVWRVEGIGDRRSALLRIDPETRRRARHALAPAAGAQLDRILRDPGLWREPANYRPPRDAGPGIWGYEMQIITPTRGAHVRWLGRLAGQGGRLVDIITADAGEGG